MTFKVLDPGFFTTIQDLGRSGYESMGVPVSGAMDRFALMAANQLVGNPWNDACIEVAAPGAGFLALKDCMVAAAGAGFEFQIQGKSYPLWMSVKVKSGNVIQFTKNGPGCWVYLAVAGGIDTPIMMGSRSTYLRGRFGGLEGRIIQADDILPGGPVSSDVNQYAGSILPGGCRPKYQEAPTLSVVLGPQNEAFSEDGIYTFLNNVYQISAASDRMGYRLEGPAIGHKSTADMISDGLALGSVQVPGSGQPIVMMSDRQTAGGYFKIATVVSADLPILAQCEPGSGQVRFQSVSVVEAQTRYAALLNDLKKSIIEPDDMEFVGGI